jgi:hypothetical protein
VRSNRRRTSHALVAAAAFLLCAVGCDPHASAAVSEVRWELSRLKAPAGMAPTGQRVELGEMDAFGLQVHCVRDETMGRVALDAMLRNAGWQPVPDSAGWQPISNPGSLGVIIQRYRKRGLSGSLSLAPEPRPCGRAFSVGVLDPL